MIECCHGHSIVNLPHYHKSYNVWNRSCLLIELHLTEQQWLGLELRHLVALKAIAEEGTFGRAAQRLGYTQSAISQQIAMLERIVGQKLIDRPGGPRPVSLTEAGELLLRHADAIAARLQAAQADLAALDAGDAGPLRIGTYQSVGAKVLPQLLREFSEQWPQVEITLQESADDGELVRLVERGELDLSFVVLPLDPGAVRGRRAFPRSLRARRPGRLAARRPRPGAVPPRAARPAADREPHLPHDARASRSGCASPAASRTSLSARTTTAPFRGSWRPGSGSRSCRD